jgi:UDP-4-amino-4,6-dideoxy-N-acetyl-beta-L-altrosamine transaminase
MLTLLLKLPDMNPIPYGKQSISEDDLKAVSETLRSDFLTQGPKIATFEKDFADYIGCRYAVAVSNGTAALHLCAMALDVNERTNVITTPITFAASANCIRYCGGNVYFADIDPATYTLDIGKVEALILSKPEGFFQGIIPVDFAGYAVNLEQFRKLADKYGLWIIEDACHAPGGYFTDSDNVKQNCGNGAFADMAIFSFHPVKHIACGEGGMITTNDEALYKKLLLLRTHGITKEPGLLQENHGGWYYEMQALGYNYRLTDFQAALGSSQLKRANEGLERRRAIAAIYEQAFTDKPYILSQSGVQSGHAYHLYVIQTPQRKELYDYLRTRNIFCQVHYIPVHTMPYYKSIGKQETHPAAEAYYDHCLSLPMYPALTAEEQQYVIDSVDAFFNKG